MQKGNKTQGKKAPFLSNISKNQKFSGEIKLFLEGNGPWTIGLPGNVDVPLNSPR